MPATSALQNVLSQCNGVVISRHTTRSYHNTFQTFILKLSERGGARSMARAVPLTVLGVGLALWRKNSYRGDYVTRRQAMLVVWALVSAHPHQPVITAQFIGRVDTNSTCRSLATISRDSCCQYCWQSYTNNICVFQNSETFVFITIQTTVCRDVFAKVGF